MKTLKLMCAVLSLATLVFACPTSISCPADRAEMHKVGRRILRPGPLRDLSAHEFCRRGPPGAFSL